MRQRAFFFAGTLAYFAWFHFFVGLRLEHTFFYILIVGLYMARPDTKRFVIAFSAFIAYWLIYDSMRVLPNYEVNPVHIEEPYLLELQMFGTAGPDLQPISPNEYFRDHGSPELDVISGLFYLGWVPIPLLFAFWLYRTRKPLFVRFSYAFLFTNILGFIIYYLYPAAPPWYIEQHGFEVKHGTPGNAAGLLNFDALLGINLFAGMYQKNANVFAAIPSLHAAYPVLCFLYGRRMRSWSLDILFLVFVGGIWFAAVYTRHHYIIDVLAGGVTAVVGYALFEFLSERKPVKTWLNALLQRI